jgi:predicted nucleotidyltransferase component of viral defense system
MNSAISSLLARYNPGTSDEYVRALREIIQHMCLVGLWRAEFFEHASFYGGTAMRMFHGLPRFSEDLDFSLLAPDREFSPDPFLKSIERELRSIGFEATAEPRQKSVQGGVESAFVKIDTLKAMLQIQAPALIAGRIHRDARIKIKVEVDIDPPAFARHEVRSLLVPIPIHVRLYAPSSLFAGKMHALLCRSWKSRVKGRDFYDFLWFLGMDIPCDIKHLKERMVQSGHFQNTEKLDRKRLLQLLKDKFGKVDFKQAAQDVLPFIADRQSTTLWSARFFIDAAQQVRVV